MNSLKKEIENAVDMVLGKGEVSKICFLDSPSSGEVKVHIEVVAESGFKYLSKSCIKSSSDLDEIKAEFRRIYPEYFL